MTVSNTSLGMTAKAAAMRASPVVINVLGYPMPVLPAVVAIVGTALASFIAPPEPRVLSQGQRIALAALLCLISVALVLAGTNNVLVATCWSIGIGYAGLPLIAELKNVVMRRAAQLGGEPLAAPSSPAPTSVTPPEPEPTKTESP